MCPQRKNTVSRLLGDYHWHQKTVVLVRAKVLLWPFVTSVQESFVAAFGTLPAAGHKVKE